MSIARSLRPASAHAGRAAGRARDSMRDCLKSALYGPRGRTDGALGSAAAGARSQRAARRCGRGARQIVKVRTMVRATSMLDAWREGSRAPRDLIYETLTDNQPCYEAGFFAVTRDRAPHPHDAAGSTGRRVLFASPPRYSANVIHSTAGSLRNAIERPSAPAHGRRTRLA